MVSYAADSASNISSKVMYTSIFHPTVHLRHANKYQTKINIQNYVNLYHPQILVAIEKTKE